MFISINIIVLQVQMTEGADTPYCLYDTATVSNWYLLWSLLLLNAPFRFYLDSCTDVHDQKVSNARFFPMQNGAS